MSAATANARRLRRARRALFGARSNVSAAITSARAVRVSPSFSGLRWLGVACLLLLALQMLTGVLLSLHYYPEPSSAYASVRTILGDVSAGWLMRAVHRWAGDVLLGLVLAHTLVVLVRRGYAKPRHLQWAAGFLLLPVVMGFRFTGRLLPWDGAGIEVSRRGLDLLDQVPLLGPLASTWLRGGSVVGPNSLARFHTTHVLILPWIAAALLAFHAWQLKRHGLSPVAREGDPR